MNAETMTAAELAELVTDDPEIARAGGLDPARVGEVGREELLDAVRAWIMQAEETGA